MAFAIGFITDKGRYSIAKNIAAVIIGNVLMFIFGLLWLKIALNKSMVETIAIGLTPFILGNALKMTASFILSITVAKKFREKIASMKEQYKDTSEIVENSISEDSE